MMQILSLAALAVTVPYVSASGDANAGRSLLQARGGGGGGGPAAKGTCNKGEAGFTCPGTATDFLKYTGLTGGEHHWDVVNPLKEGGTISFITWGPCSGGCGTNKIEDVANGATITTVSIKEGECMADEPLCVFVHDGSLKNEVPLDAATIDDSCYSSVNQLCHMCRYPLTATLDADTACEDGYECTVADKCNAQGQCIATPDSSDSTAYCVDESRPAGPLDECRVRKCIPSEATKSDGGCKVVNAEKDAPCTDGFACSVGDKCNASGECVATPTSDESTAYCVDGSLPAGPLDECRVRKCVPSADTKENDGCKVVNAEENAPCSDGFDCSVDDKCNASGECIATPSSEESTAFCEAETLPAGPLGECRVRKCVPADGTKADKGCKSVHADDGDSCDDGYGCTSGDTCSNGVCSGTPGKTYCETKSLPASVGECQERECKPSGATKSTGGCGTKDASDGTSCSGDSFSCTIDKCKKGRCVSSANVPAADARCATTQECESCVCDPTAQGAQNNGCKCLSGLASVAPNIVIAVSFDESGSVGSTNYITQKEKVADFIASFSNDAPATKWYIHTFGSIVRNRKGPVTEAAGNVAAFVRGLGYASGGTNTQAAILDMASGLSNSNCDADGTFCLGIHVTDGNPSNTPSDDDLQQFYNLDGQGTTRLAVLAVGGSVSVNNIKRFANPDSLGFTTGGFNELTKLFSDLEKEVCTLNN